MANDWSLLTVSKLKYYFLIMIANRISFLTYNATHCYIIASISLFLFFKIFHNIWSICVILIVKSIFLSSWNFSRKVDHLYAKYHHNFKSLPHGKRISHGHWRSCGYYSAILVDYFTVLHFYQVDHSKWKVASILLSLRKLYPRFIHYLHLKIFKHIFN